MATTPIVKKKPVTITASFIRSLRLNGKDLHKTYTSKDLPFKTTAQLKPGEEIIGQDKALKAIRMGVEMNSPGYNIFILGLAGTGKTTTVEKILNDMADKRVQLSDIVALHNFAEPDRPLMIRLIAGTGRQLKNEMASCISFLRQRIPQSLSSESFLRTRREIASNFNTKEDELFEYYARRWMKVGFSLTEVTVEGKQVPDLVANVGNEHLAVSQLEEAVANKKLRKEEATHILEMYETLHPELVTMMNKRILFTMEFQAKLKNAENDVIAKLTDEALEPLIKKFTGEDMQQYLSSVREELLQSNPAFTPPEEGGTDPGIFFKRFEVNILVDNQKKNRRPVVVEISPSYNNLFGSIERQYSEKEGWTTDYTQIKAGSLLRADGGFLVMNARHLFEELPVWRILKRSLLHRKLEIIDQLIGTQFVPNTLKPEPIEINTKIILVGSTYLFSVLSNYEDDFNKIFKVRAEFDYEVPNDKNMLMHFACVLKKTIETEKLPEFTRDAVIALIEIAGKLAGSQKKLSTRFSFYADLAREAAYLNSKRNGKLVQRSDVEEAFTFMKERRNLQKSKIEESFSEKNILVSTKGNIRGQVNGLAVYGAGFSAFGLPVRITSSVGIGSGNIINVERESGFSGKSYDKALYIIAGFIREKFGKVRQPAFTANIVFEQSYSAVDGDSASTAEMCALFSALGDIPIRQDIALTGSMSQKGEVQPIGGVNEKIEGFFRICAREGLTGTQGVIIPAGNVKDLMLASEVRNAVANGKFSVYAVTSIEQCIALLTGLQPGVLHKGHYPPGTVFGIIERKLDALQDRGKHHPHHAEKPKEKISKGKDTKR